MFDSLGAEEGDLAASRKIGAASWEILWSLAMHAPRVVLEANFHPGSTYERGRIAALDAEIVELYCRCPAAEVARRFTARAGTPARHRAHAAVPALTESEIRAAFDRPLGIGKLVEVDTTTTIDIAALAATSEKAWSR